MAIDESAFDDVVDEVLSEPQPAPNAPRQWISTSSASAIVVTTPFVGPKSIKKTCGPVTASCCMAAGLLGDTSVAVRDAVGGRVSAAEKVAAAIQNQLIQQLSTRAVSLGGNAVIGTQITFTEFGKNVFLGTALGTAIVLSD